MWPLWSTFTCFYQYLNILMMQTQNSSMSPANWATSAHVRVQNEFTLYIQRGSYLGGLICSPHSDLSVHQWAQDTDDLSRWAPGTASSTRKEPWHRRTLETNSSITGRTLRDVSLVFIVFFSVWLVKSVCASLTSPTYSLTAVLQNLIWISPSTIIADLIIHSQWGLLKFWTTWNHLLIHFPLLH